MSGSYLPNYFGAPSDDFSTKEPFFEKGVCIGKYTVLGIQPMTTIANRRPVREVGAGRIGARSIIGCHVTIYAGVFMGTDCRLGDYASVREDCRIGDRVVIGRGADIQYGCLIGDDVRIFNGAQIAGGTVIGSGSFIGPGVELANHRRVDLEHYDVPKEGHRAPVIGERVMIGTGAILLPGISIGDGAVIRAGAVVTRDVIPGSEVEGVPARPIGGRVAASLGVAHAREAFAGPGYGGPEIVIPPRPTKP